MNLTSDETTLALRYLRWVLSPKPEKGEAVDPIYKQFTAEQKDQIRNLDL